MFDRDPFDDVRDCRRKVFQNRVGRRPRVLDLVCKFPRRVERVHVDEVLAGSQNGRHDHGELRNVGQHDCNPGA